MPAKPEPRPPKTTAIDEALRTARHSHALWQDRDLLSAFVRDMAGHVQVFRRLAETAAAEAANGADPNAPVVAEVAQSVRDLDDAVRRLMAAADRLSARQTPRPLDS